jgi:hypothetical protein
MTPTLRLALLLAVASTTAATTAAAAPSRSQRLFFDAVYTHASIAGPALNKVGHLQLASGILHDARGHSVGRFAFTCRWTQILANNDAREHCAGWAQTPEGRLDAAGPSRRSDATHTWTVTGASGAYRGSHGSAVVRDLGDTESLFTVTLRARPGATLHAGALALPVANDGFRGRANTLCAATANQLAAMPRFPVSNFDPSHPDPKQLPEVGRFFTGPGDPRPLLRTLDTKLRALGQPPVDQAGWTRFLAAQRAALAIRTQQDNAALAADTAAFTKSLAHVDQNYRQIAINATTFGVTNCIQ